ncbi:uncharacterized protein APUU_20225A [Aspergillus puulaauensis]|uniref:Uncharacterized protein n=1 Tax=Aspergillus puulaauensis TaxID=1220207 RepID=A0A7R8AJT1_9EURO|nr:uncharacterized protein APUU_20225A [Aspergillus puulaauensis]BCS19793.1 hypothetical protein APUU_20225A [Aspergillus puulaauensis]
MESFPLEAADSGVHPDQACEVNEIDADVMGSAVTSEATKAPAKAVNPPRASLAFSSHRFQFAQSVAREIVGLVRAPLYATVSAALPEQLATVSIFLWPGLARFRVRDAALIGDPPLLRRRAVDEQIKTSSEQKQMR